MIKGISLLCLIFCSLSAFTQNDRKMGFVVLESNDTIVGTLKNIPYYSKDGVKVYQGDRRIRFSKRVLSEIHIDTIVYVKSEVGIWAQGFYRKEVSGAVNLYTFRKAKRLGGFDTDIGYGRLIPAIKFYCTDYPGLGGSIKDVDKTNIHKFIAKYNDWKLEHPESKSFFENTIHNKPLISIKVSFLLPGVGLELGLVDKLAVSAMLKNEFGYGSSAGWILNPFIDTQLRYYHNIDKRKAENKRTYKYSGDYFSLVDCYFLDNQSNLIGIEYGWQRMVNKHWYYNVGLGAGKWTTGNQSFIFLYDFDFGYNL